MYYTFTCDLSSRYNCRLIAESIGAPVLWIRLMSIIHAGRRVLKILGRRKMFNLYSHGGSGNHGCEAIVRSTIKVLNENSVNVFSHNVDQDVKYGIDDICNLQKIQ